jgi:hypothetical protein
MRTFNLEVSNNCHIYYTVHVVKYRYTLKVLNTTRTEKDTTACKCLKNQFIHHENKKNIDTSLQLF